MMTAMAFEFDNVILLKKLVFIPIFLGEKKHIQDCMLTFSNLHYCGLIVCY